MLDTAIAKRADEDHWVPLSDLMTGLMMIFMLLAIVFMLKVNLKMIFLCGGQS